jgi:hypothetical protein
MGKCKLEYVVVYILILLIGTTAFAQDFKLAVINSKGEVWGDCSEDTGSPQAARASCKVWRVWWRPSPWASRHMSRANRARICACVRTR